MKTNIEKFTVTNVTNGMINFTNQTTCIPVKYFPDAKPGDVLSVMTDAETNIILGVLRVTG